MCRHVESSLHIHFISVRERAIAECIYDSMCCQADYRIVSFHKQYPAPFAFSWTAFTALAGKILDQETRYNLASISYHPALRSDDLDGTQDSSEGIKDPRDFSRVIDGRCDWGGRGANEKWWEVYRITHIDFFPYYSVMDLLVCSKLMTNCSNPNFCSTSQISLL